MAFDSYYDFVNPHAAAVELTHDYSPFAAELEIAEIADCEMKSPGGDLALLIEKPTAKDVAPPFPVAINALGSHKRMTLSVVGQSVADVAKELSTPMKVKPPPCLKETIKLFAAALALRPAKPKVV